MNVTIITPENKTVDIKCDSWDAIVEKDKPTKIAISLPTYELAVTIQNMLRYLGLDVRLNLKDSLELPKPKSLKATEDRLLLNYYE